MVTVAFPALVTANPISVTISGNNLLQSIEGFNQHSATNVIIQASAVQKGVAFHSLVLSEQS